ncbi:hypothetical protein GDO81_027873 [Engystomops pustulosus]|uniref:Uncharacterized protein n=1 Tax=Engystomops pustulosus TaxID=76066 RepID=A0AAV6YLA1_ENGPU|nr:hypothetical protein GDO81_027873 [Engystomops pustulosus]
MDAVGAEYPRHSLLSMGHGCTLGCVAQDGLRRSLLEPLSALRTGVDPSPLLGVQLPVYTTLAEAVPAAQGDGVCVDAQAEGAVLPVLEVSRCHIHNQEVALYPVDPVSVAGKSLTRP